MQIIFQVDDKMSNYNVFKNNLLTKMFLISLELKLTPEPSFVSIRILQSKNSFVEILVFAKTFSTKLWKTEQANRPYIASVSS